MTTFLFGAVLWLIGFTSVMAALFAHELIWHFIDRKRERDQLREQREMLQQVTGFYRSKMN